MAVDTPIEIGYMGGMKSLETAQEVMDALGGAKGVRALLGASTNAVSNWKVAGKFPAACMDRMRTALAEHGYTAPPSLWGQR